MILRHSSHRTVLLVALVALVALAFACKKDDAEKSGETTSEEAPSAAKAKDGDSSKPAPVADAPKVPTGAPTWIKVDALGVQIEMPEGTTFKWDPKYKSGHLRLVPLMVNLSQVNEFSASFEKWNEKSKGLIEIVASEKTETGWMVVKKVNSEIHKKVVWETGVDLPGVSGRIRCGSAMPSKELSDAVLAACKSIKPL